MLAGPHQMSCTHAVRTTRSSSGTCWPTRQLWLLNCQKKFTLLTFTGSPKPSAERNRTKMRSLSSPALMASPDTSLNSLNNHQKLLILVVYSMNCHITWSVVMINVCVSHHTCTSNTSQIICWGRIKIGICYLSASCLVAQKAFTEDSHLSQSKHIQSGLINRKKVLLVWFFCCSLVCKDLFF